MITKYFSDAKKAEKDEPKITIEDLREYFEKNLPVFKAAVTNYRNQKPNPVYKNKRK